jgi:hypothetical protein
MRYDYQSAPANIGDELCVEQGVLLAVVLRNEAHTGHDHEDEQHREEELDKVGSLGARSGGSLQLH